MTDKIFCAIDTINIDEAMSWTKDIAPYIQGIKIGMEFFYTHGHEGVKNILNIAHPDTSLFLDLKFHDIPNTVAGAVRSTLPLNPAFLTVHAAGGKEMLTSAVNSASESSTKILAVTVLTNLLKKDLQQLGSQNDIQEQVCIYAEIALNAGVDGLICSPHEISILRKNFGNDCILIVPGIRLAQNIFDNDDQNRTMTPKEALTLGASHLVIGRPITQSKNIAQTVKDIIKDISTCIVNT